MSRQKVTILDVMAAKEQGRKLVMLTAYDYPLAQLVDLAGADIVLVGDSLGMVVMGLDGTVEVTMENMIHHIRAVRRGCSKALIVGDMPFMSYNTSIREAIFNAGRLMKEGGCDVVKLEGGQDFAETIMAIVKAGIPVQGHIGLTPQTASALRLIDDARTLEAAGCFSLILEAVPAAVGQMVAEAVKIPVIGIGAGPDVDGQVLVTHDLLGLFDKFVPKFVKQYTQIRPIILRALEEYRDEVRAGSFPAAEHSFTISEEALKALEARLDKD